MDVDERIPHPPHRVDLDEEHLIDQELVPSEENDESKNMQHSKKVDSRVSAKKCGGKSLRSGDVIWAKAFAYTWWPGRIETIKGSSASVSFYGCAKTRWVGVSDILGFEENYVRVVKMVGAKLSDAVGLALNDLQRRATLGLMCSCKNSIVEDSEVFEDQIAESARGFEPSEMLGFVLDMAVSSWVDEGKIVRAVRMSVQVSVYRQHVSICKNSEVDEKFCPVDLLDFATHMAVCWFTDDHEIGSVAEAVVQLNGYRQFVSVCPSWGYQPMELEHSFLSDESEGDHYEMFDSSSNSEIVVGAWKETEDDLLFDKQEEDFEVVEEHVQGYKEICIVNRADFSLLDLDEEYESLLDNQLEQVPDCEGSTWENIFMSENVEMRNSSAGISLEEDVETTGNKGFSFIGDVNQIADSGPCFKLDEQPINSSASCQTNNLCENAVDFFSAHKFAPSGKVIVCDEDLKQQDDNITILEPKDMDSAAEKVSSDESPLLEIVPWVGRQLVTNHANNCETLFPNETVKISHKMQSSSEVDVTVNPGGVVKTIPSLVSQERTAWQSAFKKRRRDHLFCSKSSFKLLKSLEPHAKAIPSAVNMTECCTVSYSDEEVIAEKSVNGKALMLSGSKDDMVSSANHSTDSCRIRTIKDDMRACCGTTLLKHVNQTKFHWKKGHDLPDLAKWTRFYASPLARDISKSSSHLRTSSLTDTYSGKHKSLHMKFPKDFNLPSKEELEKKFGVFGPVDCSRTKVFFYTGAAQVVFVNHAAAVAAYRYAKKKSVFGQANVRFWFDEHEFSRKGQRSDGLSVHVEGHSSSHLKSRLQIPEALHISDRKKRCSIHSRNISDDLSVHMKGRSSSHLKSRLQLPEALHVSDKEKKNCSTNSGNMSVPTFNNSTLNLKSCLRSPDASQRRNKECKVRFTIET